VMPEVGTDVGRGVPKSPYFPRIPHPILSSAMRWHRRREQGGVASPTRWVWPVAAPATSRTRRTERGGPLGEQTWRLEIDQNVMTIRIYGADAI